MILEFAIFLVLMFCMYKFPKETYIILTYPQKILNESGKYKIKILNEKVREYYQDYKMSHPTDSGMDLALPEDVTIPAKELAFPLNFGIACASPDNRGYFLIPRSSISKTPLRMANSIGIIDTTYRGEVIAKVDNLSNDEYIVKAGTKLFQLCRPSLYPFQFMIVDKLDETSRGSGGFGSTGA